MSSKEILGLDQSWFSQTAPQRQQRRVLKPGTYLGRLTKIKPGLGKPYNGEEPRKTLTFFFELESGEVVVRTVGASINTKSQCMALVTELSEKKPISLAALIKPDLLQAHLLGLIGTDYNIQIDPSACGRFNNVIKISAAPEHRGPYAV
jgi:hypothetical protein